MYEICWHNRQVGSASVIREGLYLRFHCVCDLPQGDLYKIFATDGNVVVKLGVCVPEKGKFTLNTRMPVKYLSGKRLSFSVESNNAEMISLQNQICFDYLDKLETARLQFTDGQVYIVIN